MSVSEQGLQTTYNHLRLDTYENLCTVLFGYVWLHNDRKVRRYSALLNRCPSSFIRRKEWSNFPSHPYLLHDYLGQWTIVKSLEPEHPSFLSIKVNGHQWTHAIKLETLPWLQFKKDLWQFNSWTDTWTAFKIVQLFLISNALLWFNIYF